VLLALIDLCLEGTQAAGVPPQMVTTPQLFDNLVLADVACNGFKSRSLAAADHVARWARRFGGARDRM